MRSKLPHLALALLSTIVLPTVAVDKRMAIESALQRVADRMQSKYNMSIAAAYHSANTKGYVGSISVASGFTDSGLNIGNPSRKALPDDQYGACWWQCVTLLGLDL
jgi:hypothetical protein